MKQLYIPGIALLFGLLAGCASPRAAYKAHFDFDHIRSVEVGSFTSAEYASHSGPAVAGEFMRQLLSAGYTVKTAPQAEGVDVVLGGSVIEYQPNRRYLVQNGGGNAGRQVVVVQPPVELGGNNTYNLGPVFGPDETTGHVIVSNATIGVSAHLKDAKTGEVLWSGMYTYEGLDLNTALEGAVRYLLRSWVPRYR
jgi:hypothetical protein